MRMSEFLSHWDKTGDFPDCDLFWQMSLYAGYLYGSVTRSVGTIVPAEERKIMMMNVVLFIEEQVQKDYTVTDAST